MTTPSLKLFDAFNAQDADLLDSIFDDDVLHAAPGTQFGAEVRGKDPLVEYFRNTVFPRFESINFQADNVFRDEPSATDIIEWHGSFETKAGRHFDSRGVFVICHDGSRITNMREYFDTEKTRAAFA